jgi:hypothetical protein
MAKPARSGFSFRTEIETTAMWPFQKPSGYKLITVIPQRPFRNRHKQKRPFGCNGRGRWPNFEAKSFILVSGCLPGLVSVLSWSKFLFLLCDPSKALYLAL